MSDERRVAVCYMVMSARGEARRIARDLQLARPTDEVVLVDEIHATAWPRKALREWEADVRIYVDTERRIHALDYQG